MWTIFREPTLRDLLEDPLTDIIMRHDGASRAALLGILASVSAKRAGAEAPVPPRAPKRPERSFALAFHPGA